MSCTKKALIELKAKMMKSDIDSLNKIGFRGKILLALVKLDPNNFVINKSVVAEGDELNFTVSIVARPEAINPKPNEDLEITKSTIKVFGGFKFDFSTGIYANFGNDKFYDNSYSMIPSNNSGDTLKIVKNKTETIVLPSFGAMAHFYYKFSPFFGAGLSFGLSTEQLKSIDYHLGISLMLLSKSRLVLSGGVTMRQAKYLDPAYQEGQLIPKSESLTEVPITNYNRIGGFISVTYNFSQINTDKK